METLGCELHKNAFGGPAPPGPTGGAIAIAIAIVRKGEGRGEKGKRDGKVDGG